MQLCVYVCVCALFFFLKDMSYKSQNFDIALILNFCAHYNMLILNENNMFWSFFFFFSC